LFRPGSRVSAPSSRRARAHLPFRLLSRREFHRSRDPVVKPVRGDVRLRLLGFGPAGQPSPRCRRSRYSFCA
jgi:hypothetical protein